MESIRKSDVPGFLRASALYESFDSDGEFDVPVSCFKRDCAFHNEEELKYLLRTLRYWCVEIPTEVFEFLVWNRADINVMDAEEFEEFGDYFRLIDTLRKTERNSVAKAVILAKLDWRFLRLVRLHGHPLTPECCEAAAEVGDLECLKYLWTNSCRWTQETVSKAAMNSHMECLQYAVGLGCKVPRRLPDAVAEFGPASALKFLHERKYTISEQKVVTAAAKSGNAGCLKYLASQGYELQPKFYCLAAQSTEKFAYSDPVGCLKFLHEEAKVKRPQGELFFGEFWEPPIFYAARAGNLDCVAYLRQIGDPWTEEVQALVSKHASNVDVRVM